MTASIAIQVLPKTDSESEVIRIVDEVIEYIASTGLNYYVGPFETTIEGESYDELMQIATNCQKVAIEAALEAKKLEAAADEDEETLAFLETLSDFFAIDLIP